MRLVKIPYVENAAGGIVYPDPPSHKAQPDLIVRGQEGQPDTIIARPDKLVSNWGATQLQGGFIVGYYGGAAPLPDSDLPWLDAEAAPVTTRAELLAAIAALQALVMELPA